MASLISRDGWYSAQWCDASRTPRTKRHALGTTNKTTARRLLARLDEAHLLGRWDPWLHAVGDLDDRPSEYIKLGAVYELYIERRKLHLRHESLRTYESVLNRLADAVGRDVLLERVAPPELDAFINQQGLAASTKRLRYRVVRAFLNWAEREGLLRDNPMKRVAPAKQEPRRPKVVRLEDLDAICRAVEEDYAARLATGPDKVCEGDLVWTVPLFRFAFFTGMRASELARFRWGHVDRSRGLISIPVQKNGSDAVIPLNKAAAEVLAVVPEGESEDYVFRAPRGDSRERSTRAFKNRVTVLFAKYRDAAGIKRPITLHGLRHGFCSALAEAGKSAHVIREAARHSTLSMSLVYVDLSKERLKAELDDAFG